MPDVVNTLALTLLQKFVIYNLPKPMTLKHLSNLNHTFSLHNKLELSLSSSLHRKSEGSLCPLTNLSHTPVLSYVLWTVLNLNHTLFFYNKPWCPHMTETFSNETLNPKQANTHNRPV